MRAAAPLHARFWAHDEDLAALPIAPLEATTRIVAEPILAVARGGRPNEPWIQRVLDGLFVLRTFLPIFLKCSRPKTRISFFTLCEDTRPWLAPLESRPATLLHGDLRRANIAILPDRVSLTMRTTSDGCAALCRGNRARPEKSRMRTSR